MVAAFVRFMDGQGEWLGQVTKTNTYLDLKQRLIDKGYSFPEGQAWPMAMGATVSGTYRDRPVEVRIDYPNPK